jgi:hypothetical protein
VAYSFQDRLAHNRRRFAEINAKTVTYIRASGDPVQLSVSPIKHKAMEEMSYAPSLYRVDVQCFGIDVSALVAADRWPPQDSDILEYSDGQQFRVTKKDQDQPAFDFTTSAQDRILLYTKQVKGAS